MCLLELVDFVQHHGRCPYVRIETVALLCLAKRAQCTAKQTCAQVWLQLLLAFWSSGYILKLMPTRTLLRFVSDIVMVPVRVLHLTFVRFQMMGWTDEGRPSL